MLKRLAKTLPIAMGFLMGVGCANMSTLQTAQTLPKGQNEFVVGAGYFTMPALNDIASDAASATGDDTNVAFALPYAEVAFRRGLGENIDAGAKLTLIGTAAADVKYRFLNSDGFAMAAGLGVGGVQIGGLLLMDVTVPFYMSIDLSDSFALYASPKYNLRIIGDQPIHMGGATLGTKIGSDFGAYIEFTYLQFLENFDIPGVIQVNTALFF